MKKNKTNLPPILTWFSKDWWKYLLEPINDSWMDNNNIISKTKVAWCRANGHPCGVIYWNPGGYEPDMRCRNCGDDLG